MCRIFLFFSLYSISLSLSSQGLQVEVVDIDNNPVEGVVVELKHPDYINSVENANALMRQVDRQFKPYILVVQQGTMIGFPNSDSIKHHVYSFSEAKRFQLRLYKERQPDPLLFEKSGIVAIGCNIHDWMLGYIYVAQSDLYARTDKQGNVTIDAPDNDYQLHIWHPRLKGSDVTRVSTVNTATEQTHRIKLKLPMNPKLDDSADEFDTY